MKRTLAIATLVLAFGVSGIALAATGSPTATTGAATGQTNTSATLNGTVNPNGQATQYWFQYGTTNKYGQETTRTSAGSGTTAQSESQMVSSLTPGTTYHYRIVASNASGTTAGSDMTFKTTGKAPAPTKAPTATTGAASGVSRNAATLNGTINPNGSAVSYYFEYGLTPQYGSETKPGSLPAGNSTKPVKASLNGLESSATYHYRLVAISKSGQSSIGADRTFKTGPTQAGAKLTAKTTPHRAKSLPEVFVTKGKLVPAKGRSKKKACSSGTVKIVYRVGRSTLKIVKTPLSKACTYSAKSRVPAPKHHGKHYRMRVTVRFLGNAYVKYFTGKSQVLRIG